MEDIQAAVGAGVDTHLVVGEEQQLHMEKDSLVVPTAHCTTGIIAADLEGNQVVVALGIADTVASVAAVQERTVDTIGSACAGRVTDIAGIVDSGAADAGHGARHIVDRSLEGNQFAVAVVGIADTIGSKVAVVQERGTVDMAGLEVDHQELDTADTIGLEAAVVVRHTAVHSALQELDIAGTVGLEAAVAAQVNVGSEVVAPVTNVASTADLEVAVREVRISAADS